MKTAVIYARYSSDKQTEQSIEGQLRVCQDYAKNNNIIVVDTYIDRAMTGKNDNRLAFQQMMKDCSKHQWEIVLVYKLDRFSRNKYESVVHKKTLRDNGVEIVSAMENLPNTPEGTLMESLLEGFNQYFSEELTQKVNRGLRESWLKGNATGGQHVFGYDIVNKKYVINENERQIVFEIFERYANGETARNIAESLNNKGCCRFNGKAFNVKYIYDILHSKKYIGIAERQGVIYDKIYPRIISDELWQKVFQITEENKKSPSRKKDIYNYILTGKLACGLCGHKMSGVSGTSHMGNTYYYYMCKSKMRKKATCNLKPVSKFWLEDLVIKMITTVLNDRKTVDAVINNIKIVYKKQNDNNMRLKLLQKKRAEVFKSSQNIIRAIEQGIITEMTKSRLTELENQLCEIDFEISREKQRNDTFLTKVAIEKFFENNNFKNIEDIKTRKLLINTFVKEIIIYPEKIIIVFDLGKTIDNNEINKDTIKQIERQSKSAFSLESGSTIYADGVPTPRSPHFCGERGVLYSSPDQTQASETTAYYKLYGLSRRYV